MIPLNFIFTGPFSAETREKCFCQAFINDYNQTPVDSIGIRIIGKHHEMSPILDADVFHDYYEIAINHINKMKEGM